MIEILADCDVPSNLEREDYLQELQRLRRGG
jgi:hypothetical protein